MRHSLPLALLLASPLLLVGTPAEAGRRHRCRAPQATACCPSVVHATPHATPSYGGSPRSRGYGAYGSGYGTYGGYGGYGGYDPYSGYGGYGASGGYGFSGTGMAPRRAPSASLRSRASSRRSERVDFRTVDRFDLR